MGQVPPPVTNKNINPINNKDMKRNTYLSAWFKAVHLRDELKEKGLFGSFSIEHDRLNKIVALYHSKKEHCNPLDVKYTKKIASYHYGKVL